MTIFILAINRCFVTQGRDGRYGHPGQNGIPGKDGSLRKDAIPGNERSKVAVIGDFVKLVSHKTFQAMVVGILNNGISQLNCFI